MRGGYRASNCRATDLRLCYRICKNRVSHDAAHLINLKAILIKPQNRQSALNLLKQVTSRYNLTIYILDTVQGQKLYTVVQNRKVLSHLYIVKYVLQLSLKSDLAKWQRRKLICLFDFLSTVNS